MPGDYALAQQLCQKPEMSKYSLAQALLAYTLASQRQYDKALQMARTVSKSQPLDEATVNAVGCTFKLCKADVDFAACYENAMSVGSMTGVHNMEELFHCYARLSQPKKMQQLAQRIYKASNNSKYLFWSVSSMLLQSDLPPAMLVVAEKMLEKVLQIAPAVPAAKAPGAEELHLYLTVLLNQKKVSEALLALKELRQRPVGEKLHDNAFFQEHTNLVAMQPFQLDLINIDLLRILGRSDEVLSACYAFLEGYPDQWNVHSVLLDTLLQSAGVLGKEGSLEKFYFQDALSDLACLHNDFPKWLQTSSQLQPAGFSSGEVIAKHIAFLRSQQERFPKLRGPRLAEIWLIVKWGSQNSLDSLSLGSNDLEALLGDLLTSYINKFHSKYCCFTDLKPILYALQLLYEERSRSIIHRVAVFADLQRNDHEKILEERLCRCHSSTNAEDGEECKEEDGNEDVSKDVSGNKKRNKRKNKKGKKSGQKGDDLDGVGQLKPIDAPKLQSLAGQNSDLVVSLCSFCQLDMLVIYANLLLCCAVYDLGTLNKRMAIFCESLKVFKDGVGGEKRTLQPADDILLTASAFFRSQYIAFKQAGDGDAARSWAVRWNELLNYAVHSSTFNFPLKIDLIEASNTLNIFTAARAAFLSLGVKNIQNDSMAYLCLPPLLCGTMFSEARTQCRAVLACQKAAQRETADALHHAFDFGNFNKILELSDFLMSSRQSLSLAVARAELGLIELAERNYNSSAVLTYLHDVQSEDRYMEQVVYLSDEQIDQLISHNDYRLLARLQSAPLCDDEALLRNQQLKLRLSWAQTIFLFVQNAFLKRWAEANQMLSCVSGLGPGFEANSYCAFQQRALLRKEDLMLCLREVIVCCGKVIITALAEEDVARNVGLELDPAVQINSVNIVFERLQGLEVEDLVDASSVLFYAVGPLSLLLDFLFVTMTPSKHVMADGSAIAVVRASLNLLVSKMRNTIAATTATSHNTPAMETPDDLSYIQFLTEGGKRQHLVKVEEDLKQSVDSSASLLKGFLDHIGEQLKNGLDGKKSKKT
eukprot:scaffold2066_cov229-Ochromonas_danica.AAC.15